MISISQLYIYPVKSLGGIALPEAKVTSRGLEHDRRWMLIDADKQFLSQRKHPLMALFLPQLTNTGVKVTHQPSGDCIMIPFQPQTTEEVEVTVWDDACSGTYVSHDIDSWFSQKLGIQCRLIYMTDNQIRTVDQRYAGPDQITSFSDGYSMLLASEASLADLNTRLTEQVAINRFRPNIVITGTLPYHEDCMQHFEIAGIDFYCVKPCARCVMIGVNPQTAVSGPEPLKTLAGYRRIKNKVMFGQNLIHKGEGIIRVGDVITEHATGEKLQFGLVANI